MEALRRFLVTFGLGLVLAACGESNDRDSGDGNGGGGSGGSGATFGERFEGIYTLDEIMQNEGSCDPGGESLRDVIDDTHLVAKRVPVAGTFALMVASCAGLDACRALATMLVDNPSAGEGLVYAAVFEGANGTLTGTSIYSGVNIDGMCMAGGTEDHTHTLDGSTLTVELRAHLSDYPAEGGTCSISLAAQHGATTECNRRTVVTGTLVGPL